MTEAAPTGDPRRAGGAPLRLWGGAWIRTVGGSAGVERQRPLRLAAGAVRPPELAGARPRPAPGRACSTTTSWRRCWRRSTRWRPTCVSGAFVATVADEDVHTALERGLVERLGVLGGKLRAGRSRNDQIATDLRLYLRAQARSLTELIADLQSALLEQAERHVESAAPGFTHLQRAQPVSFAHELLKHVHALTPRRQSTSRLGPADVPSHRWVPERWLVRPSGSTRRQPP